MGIGLRRFHSHGFNILHQLGKLGFREVHAFQNEGLAVINIPAVGVQLKGAGRLVRIQFAEDNADFHTAVFRNLGGKKHVNDQRLRTLEEAVLADFLIQVVDASDPEAVRHYETTLEVLNELGAGDKPMIVVLNKVDLVPEERRGALETLLAPHFSGRVVPMSVKEGNGEGDLLNACVEMLESRVRRARFLIPYTRSDLVAAMHSEGKVFSTEYVEEGTLLEAVLPVAFYNKLESFLADR